MWMVGVVAVETASREFCAVNSYVNVTLPTGYIVAGSHSTTTSTSSSSSNDDRPISPSTCDHSVKPWVIAARRGQRVNLTLYDFALAAGAPMGTLSAATGHGHLLTADGGGGGGRICRQYGWLDDSAFDRPSPLCATDRRVSVVYTSRGHVVKLWTMTPPTSVSGAQDVAAATGKRFMIKYAGARNRFTRQESMPSIDSLPSTPPLYIQLSARKCAALRIVHPANNKHGDLCPVHCIIFTLMASILSKLAVCHDVLLVLRNCDYCVGF